MHRRFLASLLVVSSTWACAQPAPGPDKPVGPSERSAVISALDAALKSNYVFPTVAEKLTKALTSKAANGGYGTNSTAQAFAQTLTQDLRKIGADSHFRVKFDPDFQPRPGLLAQPTPEQVAEGRREAATFGFGIGSVRRLPGNVGYLDIDGFGPLEFVGTAYSAALSLLAGSDALILDLRRNRGGEPASVVYLISHFFSEGDSRHLEDIYDRTTDTTREYWTDAAASTRYLQPIYVLTSPQTYSGAEACAYDLQAQHRATVVGEATGGAANPGEYVALTQGFIAFIPTGRPINAITKANWEHVGVKPDIPVGADMALKTAYGAILKALAEKATDPRRREELDGAIESLNNGETELPAYRSRH